MTITMQIKNNPMGIRYRTTLMFEFTSLGAIFTSYDVETRLLDTWCTRYMVRIARMRTPRHPTRLPCLRLPEHRARAHAVLPTPTFFARA